MWPRNAYLLIAPTRISLLQAEGFPFRQRVAKDYTHEIANDQLNESNTTIVDIASNLIKKAATQSDRLHVLLSNHCARYATLPASTQALNPKELQRFAELSMEKIYGNNANHWVVTSSKQRYNTPSLIAAIDKTIITALEKVAELSAIKLQSIQPVLPLFIESFIHQDIKKSGWTVCVLHNTLTFIQVEQSALSNISQFQISETITNEEFNLLVKRELIKQGKEASSVPIAVYAPQHRHLGLDDSVARYQRVSTDTTHLANSYINNRLLVQKLAQL